MPETSGDQSAELKAAQATEGTAEQTQGSVAERMKQLLAQKAEREAQAAAEAEELKRLQEQAEAELSKQAQTAELGGKLTEREKLLAQSKEQEGKISGLEKNIQTKQKDVQEFVDLMPELEKLGITDPAFSQKSAEEQQGLEELRRLYEQGQAQLQELKQQQEEVQEVRGEQASAESQIGDISAKPEVVGALEEQAYQEDAQREFQKQEAELMDRATNENRIRDMAAKRPAEFAPVYAKMVEACDMVRNADQLYRKKMEYNNSEDLQVLARKAEVEQSLQEALKGTELGDLNLTGDLGHTKATSYLENGRQQRARSLEEFSQELVQFLQENIDRSSLDRSQGNKKLGEELGKPETSAKIMAKIKEIPGLDEYLKARDRKRVFQDGVRRNMEQDTDSEWKDLTDKFTEKVTEIMDESEKLAKEHSRDDRYSTYTTMNDLGRSTRGMKSVGNMGLMKDPSRILRFLDTMPRTRYPGSY